LLEFVTDGTWTKRFHGGWAAHAGIIATELAQHGMTAARTAIDGNFGYRPNRSPCRRRRPLAIAHTALKYYPCNYYIQAVNGAVLELATRDDLRLEAVSSIVVHTVQAAMALVCEPIEQKRSPKVVIDAQFSVPFNVALGLNTKRVSFLDRTGSRPRLPNPALSDCAAPALITSWTSHGSGPSTPDSMSAPGCSPAVISSPPQADTS
jgi:2-methylcitrate dehydratase PrpD